MIFHCDVPLNTGDFLAISCWTMMFVLNNRAFLYQIAALGLPELHLGYVSWE